MTPVEAPQPDNSGKPRVQGLALSALAFLILYTALALAVSGLSGRPALWLGLSAILATTLAVLSAIDLATFRLPDSLTLPLAAGGLVVPWLLGDGISFTERSLAAACAFAVFAGIDLIYRRLRGRQGMGLGDAKLFAAAGSWLGTELLSHVMLWATASALAAVAVAALRNGGFARDTRIAFGPFLAFGFWMTWIGAA